MALGKTSKYNRPVKSGLPKAGITRAHDNPRLNKIKQKCILYTSKMDLVLPLEYLFLSIVANPRQISIVNPIGWDDNYILNTIIKLNL